MDLIIFYAIFCALLLNIFLLLIIHDAIVEYFERKYQPDEHEDVDGVRG